VRAWYSDGLRMGTLAADRSRYKTPEFDAGIPPPRTDEYCSSRWLRDDLRMQTSTAQSIGVPAAQVTHAAPQVYNAADAIPRNHDNPETGRPPITTWTDARSFLRRLPSQR